MSNIANFTGVTRHPSDPNTLLSSAMDQLDTAVVVGWDKDNNFFFMSSEPDAAQVCWLLDWAKMKLQQLASGS